MSDSHLNIQDTNLYLVIDSTRKSVSSNVQNELFGGHTHIEIDQDSSSFLLESVAPDWLSLIFIGCIIYFILIKFLLNINIIEGIKGLLKIEVLDDVSFEKTNRSLALFLSPYAIIVYGYYLYFLVNPLYLSMQLDLLFLVFSGIVLLLFLFKKMLELFISFVFSTLDTFVAYLLDHLFLLGVGSIIQLILLVLYTYSQIKLILWISIGFLFIFFIFRLIRSFIIGFRLTSFSKSYLFLYLCSLEILPLIWIYKMIAD